MKKRIIVLLLCALIVISLLPATSLAASHNYKITWKVYVYEDGNWNLSTLQSKNFSGNLGGWQWSSSGNQYSMKKTSNTATNETASVYHPSTLWNYNSSDYTFIGWSKLGATLTPEYKSFSASTYGPYNISTKTATYYYILKKNDTSKTYTLSYDANEGVGAPASESKKSSTGSAEFTISRIEPTRDNYNFLGWSKDKNAVEASYHGGGSITISSDSTLYAVWQKQPEKFTVTYNDGVEDEVIFEDQVYSGLLSDSLTPAFEGTPTREGYVFYGWDPEISQKVSATVVYKATWEEDKNGNGVADKDEDKYTVTYNDGVEDEVIFEDQVHEGLLSGTATPAFEGTPTREGYVFYGWNPNVEKNVSATVIYKATWEEDKNGNGVADKDEEKYTVTYNDGVENEVIFEDQVHEGLLSGTATPAFEGIPTRKGYKFIGWNPKAEETVNGDIIYSAVWEKIDGGNDGDDGNDTQKDDNKDNEKDDAPKTGDTNDLSLLFAVMFLSLSAIVTLCIAKRRTHEK